MLEIRLRHWLRDLLGEENLQWVEPSRGSSVGVCDAMVLLPRSGKLPVELKVWDYTTKGLRCDMRPAQIRYHYMTWHRKKGNTAIVFAVDYEVYVLAGQYVPKDKYDHVVAEKMVHIGPVPGVASISKATFFRAVMRAFNK